MIPPTEEAYNLNELAHALGVPWQTVMAWKRNHQIPSASMTQNGKFIKSIIDPFIEWYKNNPTTDPPLRQENDQQLFPAQNDSQNLKNSDMAKQQIRYSPEVHQEAIRLLSEQNLSAAEVAAKLGCSYWSVVNWRKKEERIRGMRIGKRVRKRTRGKERGEEDKTPAPLPTSPAPLEKSPRPSTDFDTFVKNFWNKGTRAVDVLLLPPEIGPKVLNYINEALKYGFETLR